VTIGVDFDGVVHSYLLGWHDGSIYGDPVEGAIDALRYLMRNEPVFIFTARNDLIAVAHWLNERGLASIADCGQSASPFWNTYNMLLVTNRKLPARRYVDDRAITFTTWATTLDALNASSKIR